MIRQMVLENFKSYAGAQYVGPFHKVRREAPCGAPTPPGERARALLPRAACRQRHRAAPPLARLPPATLPIPQNFSAVVGPNGSGKSNVIDAMLFVFGRRAKQVGGNALCACRGARRGARAEGGTQAADLGRGGPA